MKAIVVMVVVLSENCAEEAGPSGPASRRDWMICG
jgi:hypothetical protein